MEKNSNEDEHIEKLFKSVDIPQITEKQIESVVKVAADYLPLGRKHMSLWDMAILELRTTSIFFWAACAALMAIAVLFISSAESSFSAAGIFIVVAPAPLLFSLLEIMTTRTPNVIELEKVCKYNVNQLYVLKIMIGTVLNIVVLALISVFSLHTLNSPLQMFLMGSTIMLTIGFLALLIATTLGQSLPVMGILAGWTIAASMLFDNGPKLAMALLSIRFTPLLITLLVSTMLFVLTLHSFSHKLTSLSLGGT
nr:hypothetical protein [Coprothermobacter platensis]